MKILYAAIKLKTGQIFVGKRHNDCTFLAYRSGFETPIDCVQGFMTDENEFVDRKEAQEIAIKAGQVSSEHKGTDLYSEDLY